MKVYSAYILVVRHFTAESKKQKFNIIFMKLFKYIILLNLLINHSIFSQEKKIIEKISNGLSQKGYVDSDSLKIGTWKTFFKDGNIYKEENYIKDKLNGVSIQYYKNGQINTKEKYKNNLRNGKLIAYYEDGKISYKGKFKNGNFIGSHKEFYQNGVLRFLREYNKDHEICKERSFFDNEKPWVIYDLDKNGKGKTLTYNIDGILIGEFIHKNHNSYINKKYYDSKIIKYEEEFESEGKNTIKRIIRDFDESGKLRYERLIEGKPKAYHKIFGDSINEMYYLKGNWKDGLHESHFLNGQLAEHGNYLKDKKIGTWKSYYKNGNVKFIGNYKNNELDSIHTYYYPNKNIEKIEIYKLVLSKNTNSLKSIKTSTWSSFYSNGNIKESIEYNGERGKQGKYASYYEDGKIECEKKYYEDHIIGASTSFYENGNIKENISNHSLGRKDRLVSTYYENGNLESQVIYDTGIKNGKAIEYFENGNISSIGIYDNDNKVGSWTYYYKNKKISQKITFTEDDKFIDLFYPNGKKMAELQTNLYDSPKLKDIKVYNLLGKEVSFNEFAKLSNDCKISNLNFIYDSFSGIVKIEFEYSKENKIQNFKLSFE